MFTRLCLAIATLSATLFAGAPTITGVVNSASLIPPGLPNYGIAQGSIFNVFGTSLGPATLVEASSPLPTTLGGTTVTITVGSTTVSAPMFYSYQTQLAAILPSNTPVGTGTLTVSFANATATSPITVLQSNVGIYTVNTSGSGPAVVTFANSTQTVNSTTSTKAGDVLTIWATGLGPITGSDATPPTPVDLGTPIQVFVGGVEANLLYRGRSGYAGLDQINITVPQGVTPGCAVSLVIQTGSLVSNSTSISVSANGGACSDPAIITNPTLPAGTTSYKFGALSVVSETEMLVLNGARSTTTILGAEANFEGITGASGSVSPSTGVTVSTVSLGSCSATTVTESLQTGSGGTTSGSGPTARGLDAGNSISLQPPSGNALTLTKGDAGLYSAMPTSLSGGTYQFSNGSGGADVGSFNVGFPVPAPLVWTNPGVASAVIDRTQPLTITWTGGDPKGYVYIDLSSLFSTTSTVTEAIVFCAAPVSAGQFTVPPYALLSLIPTPAGSVVSQNLVSLGESGGQSLTIPGLDLAEGVWEFITSVQTSFK